jgi:hypothetical protein
MVTLCVVWGMARQPRIDFPGAFSHVIARGNRRATIFHDEADYLAYLVKEIGVRHDKRTLSELTFRNHPSILSSFIRQGVGV